METLDKKKQQAEQTIEKTQELLKKSPKFWIKNESGQRSASLTIAVVAFVISSLWFALSAVETIGPVKIREFNPAAAAAYLTPALALYWGRRNTRAKSDNEDA